MVTAQAKFDWITQGRTANHFDVDPVAEPHLQQPPPQRLIAIDSDDSAMATNAKFMKRASIERTAMITSGKITGFLHQTAPIHVRRTCSDITDTRDYNSLRLSFN